MRIEFPLKLISAANAREHWSVKAKRVAKERRVVWAELLQVKRLPTLPVNVKLVRIAPGTLDGDNLQSAFKATRDEIAKAFKIDDNNILISWFYAQEKSKEYRVRIEIESQMVKVKKLTATNKKRVWDKIEKNVSKNWGEGHAR